MCVILGDSGLGAWVCRHYRQTLDPQKQNSSVSWIKNFSSTAPSITKELPGICEKEMHHVRSDPSCKTVRPKILTSCTCTLALSNAHVKDIIKKKKKKKEVLHKIELLFIEISIVSIEFLILYCQALIWLFFFLDFQTPVSNHYWSCHFTASKPWYIKPELFGKCLAWIVSSHCLLRI